jgi:protein arginine kinase
MRFEDLVENMPSWLNGDGPYSEIVLSSRVRLARNLTAYRFCTKASEGELREILELVTEYTKPLLRGSLLVELGSTPPLDQEFLAERHLISIELAKNGTTGGCIIGNHEKFSIMINEEDHLRFQSFTSGLALKDAYKRASRIESRLGSKVEYAYSPEFGWLTACPTNVGTGLRASCLLHLPCLVLTGEIKNTLDNLGKLGFSVRGFYGEGTDVEGNFFQLSNQITLGKTEEGIIDELSSVVLQVVDRERNARGVIVKDAAPQIEDKLWRAYGILKYARSLSTEEFVNLSSAIRLGIGLGIIRGIDIGTLNRLLISIQPAHLQKLTGKRMAPEERDIKRAEFVRKNLCSSP